MSIYKESGFKGRNMYNFLGTSYTNVDLYILTAAKKVLKVERICTIFLGFAQTGNMNKFSLDKLHKCGDILPR